MSYKQGIMKSLEFPTGASYLSKTQCHKKQSPALVARLQKNVVVSTMSRDLIFGSHRYGCLQFKNLYTDMGSQKLEMLLGHLRKDDKTGKLLSVALGCLQQEVGTSTPVLETTYSLYCPLSTPSWMQALWRFFMR